MITSKEVQDNFDYDELIGHLIWKNQKIRTDLNGVKAGKNRKDGYLDIQFKGKMYLAHRLIWLWHGNDLPEFLDHVDCDRGNSKIENLRAASRAQNMSNVSIYCNNKSGVKGVIWSKQHNMWRARIGVNGKKVEVGLFKILSEASNALNIARINLHKEFARI